MSYIKASNNIDQNVPVTYLSSPSTIGGTSLTVKNARDGFFPSWAIQIGESGNETSEILLLGTSVPSGVTLNTTGTARFSHSTDTPVYAVKFDKVIFKRSATGTAGSAVAMTDGTVNITPDQEFTIFDDTSGVSTYAYKVSLYNSVTTVESADSDWITPSGYTFYSFAKIKERMKNKLSSTGFLKADESQIGDWANEWLETMNNTAIDVNEDYSIGTVDVAYGTAGLGTISSTDFKEIRKMDITTDGTNFYRATKKSTVEWYPGVTYIETHPYYSMEGDNIFRKLPYGTSGTARIAYYKIPSVMTNDVDELPVSMRAYSKSFVDYALSQAYYMDNNPGMGDRFTTFAKEDLNKFKSQIAPRSKSGPSYITFTDVTSGEDLGEVY
jgi:hypothetical protein